MRPLETHVELSSHLWMLNRVKELLIREGLLAVHSSDGEVKAAVDRWLDMMAEARRDCDLPTH